MILFIIKDDNPHYSCEMTFYEEPKFGKCMNIVYDNHTQLEQEHVIDLYEENFFVHKLYEIPYTMRKTPILSLGS